ncbi:MAG: tetratricopeptide repeat protein, partial [Filomicrobium sp.]
MVIELWTLLWIVADPGREPRIIADYTKTVALDPNDAAAYTNRGNSYDDKGEYALAIADFDKAIALNPNDANAYYNRGNAYDDKGEYDLAIADF